jgi:urease accessory protein
LSPQIAILRLLQLAIVPVGAYSYSEGLETLVNIGIIHDQYSFRKWLENSLQFGAIRLEAAIMVRAFRAINRGDLTALNYWNAWASAAKETEELRLQSWQMGRSLVRLLQDIQLPLHSKLLPSVSQLIEACGSQCNFAIAFAMAAVNLEIEAEAAMLGYLQSWATNLVNAGVKLIPLGQTAGQQLLLDLNSDISLAAQDSLRLEDDDLSSCSWGLALASMAHETQYTRLFRS